MNDEHNHLRAELMRLVPLVALEGRRIVEAFAGRQKLHQTDIEALSCIIRAEAYLAPLTAGALGRELGLTSGATTFLMTRLERTGLVRRERDAEDQRRVRLYLSTAGRELADAIYPPVLEASDAVMDAFTPAELETARRFLAATTEAMRSYRASIDGSDRLGHGESN